MTSRFVWRRATVCNEGCDQSFNQSIAYAHVLIAIVEEGHDARHVAAESAENAEANHAKGDYPVFLVP
ncbi:hypothetical protein B551_0224685 [Cupriavidus sp. HPC(L)]|nr:hypothetical protein B551_0224685 [Cupriavidus sp. HPC(L)]